jgi:hypothetical protein
MTTFVTRLGLWGFLGGFVGFFLWVCFGFLLVNPFSLFHFSIKLLITYQKKKKKKLLLPEREREYTFSLI